MFLNIIREYFALLFEICCLDCTATNRSPEQILDAILEFEHRFPGNSPEAINTMASGFPWNEGDEVIITLLEYHSNFLPWIQLRNR
ncbi:MAG TPA: aminotransferase class V-fold PLP-dependent enzyme [Methanospirillum sp.]|nr:aminotransferase class V-fold PLP-dependent enzyme [Methanospirillum sp.]